ncbi:histidine triad nucleotide-binding protein 3-like [Protopterus annectens]|uniref:histidine triad nucleotide-binding protein 3-like n=1 Tax=Protopterus annectens TaxID=7888 RepID=UPI001CF9FB73|nr:histidine triad nucleotide-binding protein 3-like [Protopterus annectens]
MATAGGTGADGGVLAYSGSATLNGPQGVNTYDSRCIFCRIGSGEEKTTELLHNGEEFVCFKDIRPGAPHHYLVVPKKHIGNCKTLKQEHIPLVQRMMEVGRRVLQQNRVTDLEDVRLGFHWPPFCSISHLHLHVLAPASQLGFLSRLIYRINSYWFITADQLIETLKTTDSSN